MTTQKPLNAIVGEGFRAIASDLTSLGDRIDNGNLPVLQALGDIRLMLQHALAEAGHMQADFEVFRDSTNERIAKLERRTLENGASGDAAE